jgi:hypothetical protein
MIAARLSPGAISKSSSSHLPTTALAPPASRCGSAKRVRVQHGGLAAGGEGAARGTDSARRPGYWVPQIVKDAATDMGLDHATGIPINSLTGYLVAVPFAFGVVTMIWWTRIRTRQAGDRVGVAVGGRS